MSDKKLKNNPENESEKTELAEKIAEQSKKVAKSSEHLENGILGIVRLISTFIDRVLFNAKHAKLVALILSVIMYSVVNYNSLASVYTSSLRSSKEIEGVNVTAKYNSDTFELSGLPTSADITITGDANSVTSAANNSDGYVLADLEGLTEGQHKVRLTTEGYSDNVKVVVNPSTIIVTLKKKTTQEFTISYDFINQNNMDSRYSLGTPTFEYTKVNVRASKDTLDSIAFVKALIDVSSQTEDFVQDARLVAYDSTGTPVDADIVPETVEVSVPVTLVSKSVPITVSVTGEVPDGKSINSITMDQQSVTIYGSETVLADIDNVVVTVDASQLTKDSTILRSISLPAGVSSSDISQVTMNITLGDTVTRTITDVPINVINNNNHYKASQPDNITTVSVTISGTEANIADITADQINVYINMKDAKPGLQVFTLQIDQPENGIVKYTLDTVEYELNVLGETTSDEDTSTGGNVNNE